MKFRKKPVVIEAIQFTGHNCIEILGFIGSPGFNCPDVATTDHPVINTDAGDMQVSPGDWVIKGVKGEFYPCKPDIFEATYEDASQSVPHPSIEAAQALRRCGIGLYYFEEEYAPMRYRRVYLKNLTEVDSPQAVPQAVTDARLLYRALKEANAREVAEHGPHRGNLNAPSLVLLDKYDVEGPIPNKPQAVPQATWIGIDWAVDARPMTEAERALVEIGLEIWEQVRDPEQSQDWERRMADAAKAVAAERAGRQQDKGEAS